MCRPYSVKNVTYSLQGFYKSLVTIHINTWPHYGVLTYGYFIAAVSQCGHKRALLHTDQFNYVSVLFFSAADTTSKLQQSTVVSSVSQSTCCFCCWLQLLFGSDWACSIQLQPDSGLDSEQLWECCFRWYLLLHQSGAENLLMAHWIHNIQHKTTKHQLVFYSSSVPLCLGSDVYC